MAPVNPELSPRTEAASSPRPAVKKRRGKYTSRACVTCRRRKLKCSGNDPCQRCLRRGTQCTFSDTNTASTAPRDREVEQGHLPAEAANAASTSDLSNPTSDMGMRMKNIEATLQSLVQLLPRNGGGDRASAEPQQPEEDGGFQGDTTFNAPVDAFNARLASLREQLGYSDTSPSSGHSNELRLRSVSASPASTNANTGSLSTMRFGSRTMPFPGPTEYARYLDIFFKDINPCHPCVNQGDFNSKCQKLLDTRVVEPPDACLLAINYIIFACTDILTDVGAPQAKREPPGWRWYIEADELMAKRKISGRGDLGLIQFLVYETFYLIHADKPNAAYNASGLACRLCFQFGLHQQRLWSGSCTPFSRHMRQRLFWTVYFVDRRTALSCGRPYGIRDSDIDVDQPEWIDDKALYPDRPLPDPDPDNSFNIFLSCISAFARFAGDIWDQVFSAGAQDRAEAGEKVAMLDARIKYWLDTVLPSMPLLPQKTAPTQRHLWQEALVRTRMNHLRLLLRRRTMISLAYTEADGRICGDVAMDIVKDLQAHATEAQSPSSLRFHMAFSLGGAILILATLLCRDLSPINLAGRRPCYVELYRRGTTMLRDISGHLDAAVRILDDLRDIINVVDLVLEHGGPGTVQNEDFAVVPPNVEDLFPYGFNLNMPIEEDAGLFGGMENMGDSNLANAVGNGDMEMLDSWDNEVTWEQSGHGVPWV